MMVMFGGWVGTEGTCTSDVWSYDLAAKKWTKATIASKDSPGERCNMAYCSTDDSKLAIFGGQDSNHKLHNDLWTLSLTSAETHELTWSKQSDSDAPTPRCGASLCSEGGHLYLFGGTDGKTRLNDLYCYSTENSLWTTITATGSIPPPTDAHTMVADPSECRLILFGGFGETHCGSLFTFRIKDSVWASEPRQPRMPQPRNTHRCHLLTAGDQPLLVMLMGYNTSELSDIWEIDPTQFASSSWEAKTFTGDWPLPPRRYHTTCAHESRIIMFGGWSGKEYLDSTVEIDFAKPTDAAAAKKK
eukprot:TRINITY_DN21060_c0_g1_i2.p1 TRINITY_DN21060_c0_g1~~TRINITY_DN21060_c0_g1_i2.p1  ORF type:complete len:350 (+),score=50.60 TRINITY_DN21060_c0_g1_i2:146-1051(+)